MRLDRSMAGYPSLRQTKLLFAPEAGQFAPDSIGWNPGKI
jgi:hypothetical protein